MVDGLGYFKFSSHAPELGIGAGFSEPYDIGAMFEAEVAGGGEAYGCSLSAFYDELRYVLSFEVVRYPDLFLQAVGQGGVSASGVAGAGTVSCGSAMAFDGEVDAATCFGIG